MNQNKEWNPVGFMNNSHESKLKLIKELMIMEVAETPVKISSPDHILPFVEKWRCEDREHFIVITLNGSHNIIKTRVISIGIVNRTIVHPREIFRDAILDNAIGIILVHNHPSGNVDPSTEDIEITTRLKNASKIIGIEILDHIITAKRGYYSFLEEGKL